MIKAKIIEDSISPRKVRLTTFELRYPRIIHAELLTHRVFSRNASSSRAIPVKKQIQKVWNDPFVPVYWGKNKPGMQAEKELSGIHKSVCVFLWLFVSKICCVFAYLFASIGLHKQLANRILEPFSYIDVVLTATEFENFFALRCHPDAQPEIQALAIEMKKSYDSSSPKKLHYGKWHLPYVTVNERLNKNLSTRTLKELSAARCARVSYANHDGTNPNIESDLKTFSKLVKTTPIHASPTEHQATPAKDKEFHRNFRGWIQFREELD